MTGRVQMAVYAGASEPSPVSAAVIDAITRVVVRQVVDGASTFQIVLNADLPKRLAREIPIIDDGSIAPGNRVKIGVTLAGKTQCLIDGVVVHQELVYDRESGTFTYSVIGEDTSIFMRLEEKSQEWSERSCAQIAREIIESYSSRGMTATVITPSSDFAPGKSQWLYRQNSSDLDYLRSIGRPFGHIFTVRPGRSMSSDAVAYWGPPARNGKEMPSLCIGMGAWTNVESIQFAYDAGASEGYKGQSRTDDSPSTALDVASATDFPLTAFAKHDSAKSPLARTLRFVEPSITGAIATAAASAIRQESSRRAVEVTATIDGLKYGSVILPASQMPVRGVGDSYEGLYYVERVEHTISRGEYSQEAVLSREGLGKTISEAR